MGESVFVMLCLQVYSDFSMEIQGGLQGVYKKRPSVKKCDF